MSKDLAKPPSNGERGVIVDLTLNDGLVHDTLTGIVKEIVTGMGSDLPYLYKSQVTSRQLVAQGRARYQSLLRRGYVPHTRILHLMMWRKSLHLERNAVLRREGLGDWGSM